MSWSNYFSKRKFQVEIFATIILLVLVLVALAKFLIYIENRDGAVLNDPVLNLFEPIDLTWLTFILIYISLFSAIIFFLKKPILLLTAFQAYILLIILRISAMYLMPLNPPSKIIPLTDPFVEYFGTGRLLTKDLFFSGHTAILFLLFLITDFKPLRIFLIISTILVGISVVLQHVHYSIDVITAPFFTYFIYILTNKLRHKFSSFVS